MYSYTNVSLLTPHDSLAESVVRVREWCRRVGAELVPLDGVTEPEPEGNELENDDDSSDSDSASRSQPFRSHTLFSFVLLLLFANVDIVEV